MQDKASDKKAAAPRRQGVQAIARAGRMLRALEQVPQGMALVELASVVGLPKSTVHRLVGALTEEDLLSTGADGRIVLGAGLARLALSSREALPQILRSVLENLGQQLGETIDLAVLDGDEMRFIDQLPAQHRLRAVSSVGARFPLYCTANGKAMLAALPSAKALALLPSRLRPVTAKTITTRSELLAELEQIRHQGIAFDREEHTEGICAVGAVVFDAGGPVAALSVPVPTPRFEGREKHYVQVLPVAAREASRLLGST